MLWIVITVPIYLLLIHRLMSTVDRNFLQICASEIAVRLYDVIFSGIFFATIAAIIGAAIFFMCETALQKRSTYPQKLLFRPLPVFLFFAVLWAGARLFDVPYPELSAAIGALAGGLVFQGFNLRSAKDLKWKQLLPHLNIPLIACLLICSQFLVWDQKWEGPVGGSRALSWLEYNIQIGCAWAALLGLWVVFLVLVFLLERLIDKGRSTIFFITRTITLVACLALTTLGFLSIREEPLSDKVTKILNVGDIYDVYVDSAGGRLLVSCTRSFGQLQRPFNVGFAFELADPLKKPYIWKVPSSDFEEFIFEPDSRRLYHFDQESFALVRIDADTFTVEKTGPLAKGCTGYGSIMHGLIASANRFYAKCDRDKLIAFDLFKLQVKNKVALGRDVNFLGDEDHGLLYVSYEWKNVVEARDAVTLEVRHSAPGPSYSNRMLISRARRELYLPASREAQIMVYAIPDLRLVRRIPCDYGIRVLAIDEIHNLIIVGNYITGLFKVLDLETAEVLQRHYVEKLVRRIVIDAQRRHAFISTTKGGLFLLRY